MPLPSKLAPVSTWWRQRPRREQTLLLTGATIVVLGLLWGVGLAPAWRTVRSFPATFAQQDTQVQNMLALQAQAQRLQGTPTLSNAAALQALQTATQDRLGDKATLTIMAGTAQLTLKGVAPDALAQWLATVRTSARAVPIDAALRHGPTGWTGSIQMAISAP